MRRALPIVLAWVSLVHAESRPRYGGAIEGALLGAPVALDPPAAQTHAELTTVELVFDTLYRIGPDGAVAPHLASGPPLVEPGRVRISLRPGVVFHDGSALTATDVAASLERVRRSSARWILAAVTEVRADGDGVALALAAPVPELERYLALPATAITRAGKPPGERPIGSGPFAVVSLDQVGRRLVLRAFEAHFAGRPYVDQLTLRWYDTHDGEARRFERGESHLSARGVAAFTGARPKYRADDVEGPATLLVFLGFGRAHAQLTADRGFRRALDLALARGAFGSVTSGERVVPSRLPLPVEAGAPVLDATGRADDLPGARRELAGAARRVTVLDPARRGALALEILIDETRPDDRLVAERVAHALRKLTLASKITAVSAATLRERVRRGACDLWIGQLAAPVTSATAWWGAAFAAGGDPWAEHQLAAGALDTTAAIATFRERLPIVPLLFRAVRMWHRTDVRGLRFDASGRPAYADLFVFGAPVRTKAGRP